MNTAKGIRIAQFIVGDRGRFDFRRRFVVPGHSFDDVRRAGRFHRDRID